VHGGNLLSSCRYVFCSKEERAIENFPVLVGVLQTSEVIHDPSAPFILETVQINLTERHRSHNSMSIAPAPGGPSTRTGKHDL